MFIRRFRRCYSPLSLYTNNSSTKNWSYNRFYSSNTNSSSQNNEETSKIKDESNNNKEQTTKTIRKSVIPENNQNESNTEDMGPKAGNQKFQSGIYIYGGIVIITMGITLGFKGYQYWKYNPISIVYLGRGTSFDETMDDSTRFPITDVSLLFFRSSPISLEKELSIAKNLENDYPTSVIPQLLFSHIYFQNNNLEEAERYLNIAHEYLDAYPDINEPFKTLFPIESVYYQPPSSNINEVKSGRIWTIEGYTKTDVFHSPGTRNQSTILKLMDGSLIIFNPISFSNENINSINQMGDVRALISTATSHSSGIRYAHDIWPDAELYGSRYPKQYSFNCKEIHSKEGIAKNLLFDELITISHIGNSLNETVIYDPATKTLIGPTDTVIRNPLSLPKKTLNDVCLSLRLGFFRGNTITEYLCPNRVIANTIIHAANIDFLNWVYDLDVDTIILAHGGIVKTSTEEFLKPKFNWLQYYNKKMVFKSIYQDIKPPSP